MESINPDWFFQPKLICWDHSEQKSWRMHRVHHWGLCSILFEQCSCAVPSSFKGLNIKYQPGDGGGPCLTSFLPSPCPGARNSDSDPPPWAGNSSPLLCSSLQREMFCPARLCPAHSSTSSLLPYPGRSTLNLEGFCLASFTCSSSHTSWEQLPPPSDFSFHPTMPKPLFPFFLSQSPYPSSPKIHRALCYDLSATCPDKGFFYSCLILIF